MKTLAALNRERKTQQPGQVAGSGRIRLKCIVLGAAGAGKTSILRRYFRGTFEGNSRIPTLGSDFYTGRVRTPSHRISLEEKKDDNESSSEESFVSLQVWDTAGRERKAKYTAALSDDFFRHADAAMLVYDATSSTSFTQLMKWHSDLMERMKNLNKQLHDKRPFPVLIVGNKMDIIAGRQRQNQQPESIRSRLVPQRDVMGLQGKSFKGKDSRYEYRVSPSKNTSKSPRRFNEIPSTYLATNGGDWTTDGSYLDSVLNSEDRSHPDHDMVLLWCMRNGLTHIEASALDGTGIERSMESLALLAFDYKVERDKEAETEKVYQKQLVEHFQTNKALDLHQLYSPKEKECCRFLRPPWCN